MTIPHLGNALVGRDVPVHPARSLGDVLVGEEKPMARRVDALSPAKTASTEPGPEALSPTSTTARPTHRPWS